VRILVAAIAAGAVAAALAGPHADVAVACSCAGAVPALDLPRYDAAFIGTVVSHRVTHPTAPLISSADPAYWTFEVERAVKGDLPHRVVVGTAASGASCGLELERGQRIGLLLTREGDVYTSGLCSQVDPDVLARAVPPPTPVAASSDDDSGWRWWAAGVGGGLIAALALAGVALGRRRG